MKKFLNISLVVLVALSSVSLVSCKNETKEIFDDDAVARLDRAKADYAEILTDKGGKWQMEYFSNDEEPGYIYVMTFNKNGSVTISGKNKWIGVVDGLNLGSIGYGSATSLWEIIADNGPVLSFNSFNKYFHLFADPEDIPSNSDEDDNEQGYGHRGDYEFDLMKYSGDTLYITGKKHGIDMRVGNILSSDPFYAAEGCSKNDRWKRMGVLAVEMEAAGLYSNAAYAGKRALCICTISDHIYRPEDNLPAEARQNSFTQMMEVALDTAAEMAKL